MRKRILTALLTVCLLTAVVPGANAVSLLVNGTTITNNVSLQNSTTYVPIRATTLLLSPGANISWENGQAVVRTSNLTIIARPGNCYIEANGRMLYVQDGVKLVNGTTLVPIRALAKALGAAVLYARGIAARLAPHPLGLRPRGDLGRRAARADG